MKVKLWIDTGYAGCVHEETIEVDDNKTEEDIEEIARDWVFDMIEWGWDIEKKEEAMNIPKFRVWITYGYTEEDLKNPDMVEEIKETGLGFMGTPDLIDFRNDEIRVKYDCDWYDSDRFTLMQSTGLKDRTGSEIFEGDIFTHKNNHKFVVKWDEDRFVGLDNKRNGDGYCCYISSCDKSGNSTIEVIGNIYENPELLEEV